MLATAIGAVCLPQDAAAVAGFSRQMNMECMACHNQTMRQLNAFGRLFASSGYTMTGGPQASSMIEGAKLGLGMPAALNASVMLKARYEKSFDKQTPKDTSLEDVGTDRGSLELFKASRIFLGGRVADNFGALANFNTESWGAKVVGAFEYGDDYAGGVLFMQEDSGPFSGMEYYNTGLYKPLRLFESRKSGNAAQATKVGSGPASGGQLYYGGTNLYATVGAYVPAVGGKDGLDVGTDFIPFGRVAYEYDFDFGSLMIGGYLIKGEARLTEASLDGDDETKPQPSTAVFVTIEKDVYGFDMDYTTEIMAMPLEVVLQAILKNRTKIDPDPALLTLPEGYVDTENKATSLEFQLTPIPELAVRASAMRYLDDLDGDLSERTVAFGLDYIVRQNIIAGMEYTFHTFEDTSSVSDYKELYLELVLAF